MAREVSLELTPKASVAMQTAASPTLFLRSRARLRNYQHSQSTA